jgi:hypothetical protein
LIWFDSALIWIEADSVIEAGFVEILARLELGGD